MDNQNITTLVIIIVIILIISVIIVIVWIIFRQERIEDENNGVVLIPCNEDGDCPGTNICKDAFCRPECQTSADCPERWSCINTTCQPECSIDDDCITGWTCEEGTCTPECVDDNDCGVSETCNNGICQLLNPGCNFIDIPTGLTASQTNPGEITANWDQASGATGYVCYLGSMSGFNPLQAIDSKLVSEPSRIAVFTTVNPGTYYVRVSATSPTCVGTALSTEAMVVVS